MRRVFWLYFGISWLIWTFLSKPPLKSQYEPILLGLIVGISNIIPWSIDQTTILIEKCIRGP